MRYTIQNNLKIVLYGKNQKGDYMGIALFMTFIFLHVAFGLALAFFVMHYASKSEPKNLRLFGFFVGYLLIALSLVSIITSAVLVAKKPHFMPYPPPPCLREKFRHEEMNEHEKPEIYEQKSEKKNEKKITYKHEAKNEGKSCPVKTKKDLEKDLKDGKITGAACRVGDSEKSPKKHK